MKYSVLFMLSSVLAQQAPAEATPYDEVSKNIENRVKADLMMQIANYDLVNTLTNSVEDTKNISYEASGEMSPQTFEDLLQRISELLQEKDTIRALWPEAENYADSDLFSHLHIEFDSKQSSVKLATAGTGYDGQPIHDYEYSLKGQISAEPVQPAKKL